MASKQANEINNSNKESKAGSTGNDKGRARFIFPCVRSRKKKVCRLNRYQKRRKAQRRGKNGEEGNQHLLKQRKEKRATGTMRVNQRNPPPFSGRFISQRATKSEPRGSAVILDPVLTFKPREIPRGTRKTSLAGVFHLKGKERKTGKNSGRDQP